MHSARTKITARSVYAVVADWDLRFRNCELLLDWNLNPKLSAQLEVPPDQGRRTRRAVPAETQLPATSFRRGFRSKFGRNFRSKKIEKLRNE